MTPYERTTTHTTSGPNEIVAVPCPGRCRLDRVAIVRVGTGAFTADFFNRAFTGTSQQARLLTNDGTGKCRLTFPRRFAVRAGDAVTVSGSATTAYNTTHRVTRVDPDDRTVDTDQSFTVEVRDATAVLAIPTTEQPLYKAAATLTGTDNAESAPAVPYVNQDPQANLTNRGFPDLLYVKFATAATYRLSLRCSTNVAEGS